MRYQATNSWSYHVISKRKINFFHVLLSKLDHSEIENNLTYVQKLRNEADGSITIFLTEDGRLQQTISELTLFLQDVEAGFVDTPKAYFTLLEKDELKIKEWYFSIMGTIALILVNDPLLKDIFTGKWEYLDSAINTLYVEPYTFMFTSDYVKVIHPVRPQNYSLREHAEKVAALSYSQILKRFQEAYPGCEGLAILSYAQEKIGKSSDYITSIIQHKSQKGRR